MKIYKTPKGITIERTEQWEYTASYKNGLVTATGASETNAELNLLRKMWYMLNHDGIPTKKEN